MTNLHTRVDCDDTNNVTERSCQRARCDLVYDTVADANLSLTENREDKPCRPFPHKKRSDGNTCIGSVKQWGDVPTLVVRTTFNRSE